MKNHQLASLLNEAFAEAMKFCRGVDHDPAALNRLRDTLDELIQDRQKISARTQPSDRLCQRCHFTRIQRKLWAAGVRHCSYCRQFLFQHGKAIPIHPTDTLCAQCEVTFLSPKSVRQGEKFCYVCRDRFKYHQPQPEDQAHGRNSSLKPLAAKAR